MQPLSTVLSALQQPMPAQEPKNAISPILRHGLTAAGGKMSSVELQNAAVPTDRRLTREEVNSMLSSLRSLNSSRAMKDTWELEDPNYPNGRHGRQMIYQIPEEQVPAYRSLLIQMIRPAASPLITKLIGYLMAEKPFFDADEIQIKYRLQTLTSDLSPYPHLAIWLAIDEIRTTSERKGFPETAEILKKTRDWAEYVADGFKFFNMTSG